MPRLLQDFTVPHELLGNPVADVNTLEPEWRRLLRVKEVPWLRSHVIQGDIVFPAAAYIAMAIEAITRSHEAGRKTDREGSENSSNPGGYQIRNCNFGKALVLAEHDGSGCEISLSLRPETKSARSSSSDWREFRVFSTTSGKGWTEHCRGSIRILKQLNREAILELDPENVDEEQHRPINKTRFYVAARQVGMEWKPPFDCLRTLHGGPDSCVTTTYMGDQQLSVTDPPMGDLSRYLVHPAILDAALFHGICASLVVKRNAQAPIQPTFIRHMTVANRSTASISNCYRTNARDPHRAGEWNVQVVSPSEMDQAVISARGVQFSQLSGNTGPNITSSRALAHTSKWFRYDPNLSHAEMALHADGGIATSQSNGVESVYFVVNETGPSSMLTCVASFIEQQNSSVEVSLGLLQSVPDVESSVVVLGPEICDALSEAIDEETWQQFQRCALSCKGMLMISSGTCTPVLGLARCLRLENPRTRYVVLELDDDDGQLHKSQPDPVHSIAETISKILLTDEAFDYDRDSLDVECEFALRQGSLHVNRQVVAPDLDRYVAQAMGRLSPRMDTFADHTQPLRVELGVPGLLETFRWVHDADAARASLSPDEIRLETRAASINFRDVLVATGHLQGFTTMANDCAGVVVGVGSNMAERYTVGDRVCSAYAQSYNNFPVVHGDCCAHVPDDMSDAVAASIPIVWATVYHSLVHVARLSAGESILIHAGAGAVGQAAVTLAQHLGADVYVTVGSQEKREFVQDRLQVPADHIFTSRTTAFGADVRLATQGRGVDVILNSLGGDLARENIYCLASFGRLVEIGKKHLLDDSLMPTRFMLRNITFACVDLNQMIAERKPAVQALLKDVIRLVTTQRLRPISLVEYPLSDIESAFRLIAAGKHVGKVILSVVPDQQVKVVPQAPPAPSSLDAKAAYLLIGGLGGLGMQVAEWLASRGAQTIVILSRSGASTQSAQAWIADMRRRGVTVLARKSDVSSKPALARTLDELRLVDGIGAIKGVVNAAMILQDASFERMTCAQWQSALAPKVAGTRNLHDCLPRDMDFFISLSSVVSIAGFAGQANYAAACSFQDGFSRYRRTLGLPAYSINIGPVADAGFVSETPHVYAEMQRQGFEPIRMAELLAAMDYVLMSGRCGTPESGASVGLVPRADHVCGQWIRHRRLSHLVGEAHMSDQAGSVRGESAHAIQSLATASTMARVTEIISEAVQSELSKLTITPREQITAQRSLDSYGVGALVAVQLRNWIVAVLKANVSLLTLRKMGSIHELIVLICATSKLVSPELHRDS